MTTISHSIRQLASADQQFLWEMLYQSLFVSEGSPPFPRDIIKRPEIARYVRAWGGAGDMGFVAMDIDVGEPIGAAWLRLLKGDERGYGYVDDETPELGMAVLAGAGGGASAPIYSGACWSRLRAFTAR